MSRQNKPRYWYCIIGPVMDENLPMGADLPPRLAARRKVFDITGVDPPCVSGWIFEDEVRRIEEAQCRHADQILHH
jgi:hypothetical protein